MTFANFAISSTFPV